MFTIQNPRLTNGTKSYAIIRNLEIYISVFSIFAEKEVIKLFPFSCLKFRYGLFYHSAEFRHRQEVFLVKIKNSSDITDCNLTLQRLLFKDDIFQNSSRLVDQ